MSDQLPLDEPPRRPPPPPPPSYIKEWPDKGEVVDFIGECIYAIRFALIPMYLLLWIALIAYNVQYAREIWDFIFIPDPGIVMGYSFRDNDSTHYLLFILSLIDITMIGNLVVMTTIGGFSTFVKEYRLADLEGRPRWMNGLDSTALKNKMGMSLIGVSAIHLLKTFMENVEKFGDLYKTASCSMHCSVDPTSVYPAMAVIAANTGGQIIIHLVFIVTTLAFAKNALLMHAHTPKPSEAQDGH